MITITLTVVQIANGAIDVRAHSEGFASEMEVKVADLLKAHIAAFCIEGTTKLEPPAANPERN